MSEEPPQEPSSGSPSNEKGKVGFEMRVIELPLEAILPVRIIKKAHNLNKYQGILVSMRTVGMIEPLIVYPQRDKPNTYLLMDGHLRYAALKEIGETKADCIVATEDESFTYNARVNRLPPIQSHKMIVKAVRNGVRVERIAAALDMPLPVVQGFLTLLDGINDIAAQLLRAKEISPKTIRQLKKVSNLRQIEIAELMVAANNYGYGYAEALIRGTPKDQLVNIVPPKEKTGLSPEEAARMQREMESLERDFKGIEASYADNMMNLTVGRGFIKRLIDNGAVKRFLKANYPDILTEFESVAAAESL